MSQTMGDPTLLQEDEEVLGDPSFELLVRDDTPVVSGSYFIHPPLRAVEAEWDDSTPRRIIVRADDGTSWFGDVPEHTGHVNVVLQPETGTHAVFDSRPVPEQLDEG